MANRFATAFAGLAVAGRAVGLDDHYAMLQDHRRRLLDGHRAQMAALGQPITEPPEDEEMDVQVTGDITNYITTTQPNAATSPISRLLPYVLAAAALAGGGGVGGALLTKYLTESVVPVVSQPMTDTDTDTQYELSISSGE